jgi:hypothetical protein
MSIFDNIPAKYNLSEIQQSQYEAYSNYLNLIINAKSENSDIYNLNEDEYQNLRDLVQLNNEIASDFYLILI